jgi:hypothetical protein
VDVKHPHDSVCSHRSGGERARESFSPVELLLAVSTAVAAVDSAVGRKNVGHKDDVMVFLRREVK